MLKSNKLCVAIPAANVNTLIWLIKLIHSSNSVDLYVQHLFVFIAVCVRKESLLSQQISSIDICAFSEVTNLDLSQLCDHNCMYSIITVTKPLPEKHHREGKYDWDEKEKYVRSSRYSLIFIIYVNSFHVMISEGVLARLQ